MDEQFKKITLEKYKHTVAKISEAQEALRVFEPQFQALAKVIDAFGWQGEIERPEEGDDFQQKPDMARSKGQKIAHLATEFFKKNNNQWTSLSDLYLYVSEKGIPIGGKNPNSNLSAHLSNSAFFESDRSKGWRMNPEFWTRVNLADGLPRRRPPVDLVGDAGHDRAPDGGT